MSKRNPHLKPKPKKVQAPEEVTILYLASTRNEGNSAGKIAGSGLWPSLAIEEKAQQLVRRLARFHDQKIKELLQVGRRWWLWSQSLNFKFGDVHSYVKLNPAHPDPLCTHSQASSVNSLIVLRFSQLRHINRESDTNPQQNWRQNRLSLSSELLARPSGIFPPFEIVSTSQFSVVL